MFPLKYSYVKTLSYCLEEFTVCRITVKLWRLMS